MSDEQIRAAAEESAAAAPHAPPADHAEMPASAEEAQAAATDALDAITLGASDAVAGDEVESAEEVLPAAEPDLSLIHI